MVLSRRQQQLEVKSDAPEVEPLMTDDSASRLDCNLDATVIITIMVLSWLTRAPWLQRYSYMYCSTTTAKAVQQQLYSSATAQLRREQLPQHVV